MYGLVRKVGYCRLMRQMSTSERAPPIRTAAMLVIGDEVLNGKIKDTNSQYFAQFCFELGIDLRRVAVVPDTVGDIVETLNYLRSRFDFIVTTGGIGPTHDDITYESIAQAYQLPLRLDEQTVGAMDRLAKHPPKAKEPGSSALHAQLRMATFPDGPNVSKFFANENLWVPIVNVDQQVYIFPGIPSLYRQMMEGLRPRIEARVDAPKMARRYVSTTTVESVLASILGELQSRYEAQGVKIGSYPHFHNERNTISIIGPESNTELLQQIVNELLPQVEASHEISPEEEASSH